ncbi:SLC13 family permease [Caproicibacterium sp. NSD3]
MASSTIAIIITVITMIIFMIDKLPMSVTACLCALAMGIALPEMKLSQIYSGFGGSSIVMVAGMMIVGDALFQTGVAQRLGAKIGKLKIAQNEKWFIVLIVIVCTIMSAFMSNSGCIAMWMPIIAAVAAGSNGKIRSKMVIMPAGIACIVGGGSTLTGSVSQVTANSILMGTAGYEAGMGVFDMTRVMWSVCIVQVLFWATIGYTILVKVLKPESPDFDKGNSFAEASSSLDMSEFNKIPKWKGTMSLVVMAFCVIAFILSGFKPFSKYLDIADIAMIGSMVLFVTGTISVKKTLASMDWNILIMVGAITALGTGLDVSGGGKVIADSILGIFGGANASVVVLMTVLVILSSVLTNFMQNGGVAAMLTPVYISLALSLGISPLPFVIAIGITTNLAICTPIGTAVNMQILPAGYKFSDYMKIGGPLFIIMVAMVAVLCPLVLF